MGSTAQVDGTCYCRKVAASDRHGLQVFAPHHRAGAAASRKSTIVTDRGIAYPEFACHTNGRDPESLAERRANGFRCRRRIEAEQVGRWKKPDSIVVDHEDRCCPRPASDGHRIEPGPLERHRE